MVRVLQRVGLALAVAVSVLSGTAVGAAAAPPASPANSAHPSTRAARPATGQFVAAVDFATLVARPVRGNKCEFSVNGTLTFTGTLSGDATGTTTAVIFAPCSQATVSAPGTFFDVFRFEGTFAGTINGAEVGGDLSYAGVTRPGGEIDARIVLDADRARAVLRADARVADGGSYAGVVKVW